MKEFLNSCPCGRNIDDIIINESGQGGKWAWVSGNCCGEWNIEFRTGYNDITSDECKRLAIEAWNRAPRADKTNDVP